MEAESVRCFLGGTVELVADTFDHVGRPIQATRLRNLAAHIRERADNDFGLQELLAEWPGDSPEWWAELPSPAGGSVWDWAAAAPDPREGYRRLRISCHNAHDSARH